MSIHRIDTRGDDGDSDSDSGGGSGDGIGDGRCVVRVGSAAAVARQRQ